MWSVVNEFCPFVEERGIVFVRLHDKVFRFSITGRHIEVRRHATDQKTRRMTRFLQNPRQHAGSSCLSVRSRNSDYVAILQHVFRQPLRPRGIGNATVQDCLDCRVAPAKRVANHDTIGPRLQLANVVAIMDGNAETL